MLTHFILFLFHYFDKYSFLSIEIFETDRSFDFNNLNSYQLYDEKLKLNINYDLTSKFKIYITLNLYNQNDEYVSKCKLIYPSK